jgi:hypothetical protein
MGETLAIINVGKYIRDYAEKNLKKLLGDKPESPSWENFVRNQPNCYRLIHVSTYVLFIGLFWGSIIIIIWFKLNAMVNMPFD